MVLDYHIRKTTTGTNKIKSLFIGDRPITDSESESSNHSDTLS